MFDVIKQKQQDTGITVAELSRRTGIKYERLRTSLEGTRGFTGSELVFVSRELGLSISDFDSIDPIQTEAESVA